MFLKLRDSSFTIQEGQAPSLLNCGQTMFCRIKSHLWAAELRYRDAQCLRIRLDYWSLLLDVIQCDQLIRLPNQ